LVVYLAYIIFGIITAIFMKLSTFPLVFMVIININLNIFTDDEFIVIANSWNLISTLAKCN